MKADPDSFEQIGQEITFEVDIVPPQLFKREIVRPKYRSKTDRSRPPLLVAAPARPVDGGYASAGLLAHVVVSKYVDHLSLYRQQRMFERWQAPVSRQSMADWVRIAAFWLEPIYRLIGEGLLAGGYVQVDETPIRCRDPDQKRGKPFQGFLWVMGRPNSDVFFEWGPTHQYGQVNHLLGEDYDGILQSDVYEAYEAYARAHPEVVWVACWAHVRRRFFEAQSENPKAVRVALELARRRQKHFARSLDWFDRLDQALRERYLLNHWKPLTAHVRYERTRLDNNLIEQAIRPSGKRIGCLSAIIYSLVVSCQRHGKDTQAYLTDVLRRPPVMTTQDDMTELMPDNWQPT